MKIECRPRRHIDAEGQPHVLCHHVQRLLHRRFRDVKGYRQCDADNDAAS